MKKALKKGKKVWITYYLLGKFSIEESIEEAEIKSFNELTGEYDVELENYNVIYTLSEKDFVNVPPKFKMFQTVYIPNEAKSDGWSGKVANIAIEDGVYIYEVHSSDSDGVFYDEYEWYDEDEIFGSPVELIKHCNKAL